MIERVFLGKEVVEFGIAIPCGMMEKADVAAGDEGEYPKKEC